MNILPVQTSQYNSRSPAFKSWSRDVYKTSSKSSVKELKHRNDTWFFRNSGFWAKLTTFFVERFKDVPKVNVYSYGCSDGSEPFTFAMRMLSVHGQENAKKFLPVIAKDYDKEAIKKATSCEPYFLEDEEKMDIDYYTQGRYKKFFNELSNGLAYLSPELYNSVKFSVADISSDYKKIKPDNSIVMARNFWPYIGKRFERQKVLNKIAGQLGENSFLVVGIYDNAILDGDINKEIIEAGFKPTAINYVFEKVSNPKKRRSLFSSLRSFF